MPLYDTSMLPAPYRVVAKLINRRVISSHWFCRSPSGQRHKIAIFGTDYPTPDGTNIRDYIHIRDLVSAHLLALEGLNTKIRLVYNLGNGLGYSVREVIDTARKVTGHPIPVVETSRRPGDAPRLVASSDKIRRELGLATTSTGPGRDHLFCLGMA